MSEKEMALLRALRDNMGATQPGSRGRVLLEDLAMELRDGFPPKAEEAQALIDEIIPENPSPPPAKK